MTVNDPSYLHRQITVFTFVVAIYILCKDEADAVIQPEVRLIGSVGHTKRKKRDQDRPS